MTMAPQSTVSGPSGGPCRKVDTFCAPRSVRARGWIVQASAVCQCCNGQQSSFTHARMHISPFHLFLVLVLVLVFEHMPTTRTSTTLATKASYTDS